MLPSAEHVVKEGKFHTSRSVCLSATTQTWFLVVWDTQEIVVFSMPGSCPSWPGITLHKTPCLNYQCYRIGCGSRWDGNGKAESFGCQSPAAPTALPVAPTQLRCPPACPLSSPSPKSLRTALHPLTPSCSRQPSPFGAQRGAQGAALPLPSRCHWEGQVDGGAVGACICASSSGLCSWCSGQ